MATKKCINGHIYDPNVYGETCPFCPAGGTVVNENAGGHTHVNGGGFSGMAGGGTKPTIPVSPANGKPDAGGGTVIRHIGGNPTAGTGASAGNRRLVGLLVCYDINPLGEVFKIYEGRNMIGRKATVDVVLAADSQISSEHLIILYREAEGVFWAIDNNSSNGTYINGSFENKAKLNPNDIITIGNTRLIFIAIPRLPKQQQ